MSQDAGMGGLGWTAGANAGGTGAPQPTGSPTPDLQYDLSQAAAGSQQAQNNISVPFNLQQQQQALQQQGTNQAGSNALTTEQTASNVANSPDAVTGG